jgi:hypothetical protein
MVNEAIAQYVRQGSECAALVRAGDEKRAESFRRSDGPGPPPTRLHAKRQGMLPGFFGSGTE